MDDVLDVAAEGMGETDGGEPEVVAKYRVDGEQNAKWRVTVGPESVHTAHVAWAIGEGDGPPRPDESVWAADPEVMSRIHCVTAAGRLAWSIGTVLGISVDVAVAPEGSDVNLRSSVDHIRVWNGTGVRLGIESGRIPDPSHRLSYEQLAHVIQDVWVRIVGDDEVLAQAIAEYVRRVS